MMKVYKGNNMFAYMLLSYFYAQHASNPRCEDCTCPYYGYYINYSNNCAISHIELASNNRDITVVDIASEAPIINDLDVSAHALEYNIVPSDEGYILFKTADGVIHRIGNDTIDGEYIDEDIWKIITTNIIVNAKYNKQLL